MRERVFVGLSGGVDSSVAAKRLIDAGHDVVGVFIKTWQPDFIPCTWEAERRDAMRVAAHLNIPFLTCDAEASYRDEVAAYMIKEYAAGRTPNPDVMCNKYVKFGTFLEFARAHGADKIATGHYARMAAQDGDHLLQRGLDPAKDQSYFLWTLTASQRASVYFPIGDTVKSEVRKEAARAGLPTSTKEDSQGICFLGEIDMKEFLKRTISVQSGVVLDEQGAVIGTHDGALLFTIGQRHGFKVTSASHAAVPQYVVSKNLDTNTITVSPDPRRMDGSTITLRDVNWIGSTSLGSCLAQCRYRQKPFRVTLTKQSDTEATLVVEDSGIEAPSIGQACVLYDGDYCQGGGFISGVE